MLGFNIHLKRGFRGLGFRVCPYGSQDEPENGTDQGGLSDDASAVILGRE